MGILHTATTFGRLLPDSTPSARAVLRRIEGIGPSSAHLSLYVGVSGERLSGPLVPSNLWIHPTLDFDRNWSAFAADLEAPFPLMFVSFPSAKDPAFEREHPGCQTIEVVVPAPYEPFARWSGTAWKRRGEGYSELKAQLADRLLAALRTHLPQVAGAIETYELSTPLSTTHFVNAEHGETYGLTHTPERFMCRALRPATPIRNLFLTGQDVSTCGVTGALAGAIATASALLGRNLFKTLGDRKTIGTGTGRRAA